MARPRFVIIFVACLAMIGTLGIPRVAEAESPSVQRSFRKLAKLEIDRIPVWPSGTDVAGVFARIRDRRFLPDPDRKDGLRRIPWRYPDDGCMVRAAIAIHEIARAYPELPTPAKLYVNGELKVSSEYATGNIEYSYHVAPAVRMNGKVIVFDPTLDAAGPLSLEVWAEKMLPRAAWGSFAACDATSFNVDYPCLNNPTGDREAELHAPEFLRRESTRLRELGRTADLD